MLTLYVQTTGTQTTNAIAIRTAYKGPYSAASR